MGKTVGFDIVNSGTETIRLVIRGQRIIKSAKLRKVIMSDDRASYEIESATPIPFKLNDTVNIYGQKYRLNNPPTVEKVAESLYKYSVEFEGVMYDLLRCQFFNADGTGFKTTADFSIVGNIETFLTVVVNNMKRFSPNWKVGTYQNKDTKTIAFNGENCLHALQRICAEFNIEFRIDEINGEQLINVGNFGQELPLTFEYGKGKGLYSLVRTNVSDHNIVNRLYVSGGSENLPEGYRNFSDRLKLPAPLEYLEDADNIAINGLREGSLELEIYPHRTGKVTGLGDNIYRFSDSTMDFDLKAKDAQGNTLYLKNGESAKVHFNTGNLAGYSFEIKNYDHATKSFEIIPFKNDQGQQFPDPAAGAFQFAVNDEYVLINIYAPDSYLQNAENELLTKASAEFEKFKSAQVNYRINVDPAYLKKYFPDANAVPFNLHDSVKVRDAKLAVDRFIKITGFTRDILSPWKYDIDVADSYEIAYASQVALQVSTINNTVAAQSQQIKLNYRNGYERIQQLNDLVFDTDGYFDTQRIKPLSIETQMLSVGSRSQMLTLEGVVIEPNETGDPSVISVSTGKLVHFTIEEQVREWQLPGDSLDAADTGKSYYLYAKCPKMAPSGSWLVTTEKLKFDFDPSAYHFLIGVLHPVNAQNFRYYTPLEGATMINGRYITTGKVQSVDGSTWFDLDLGAMLLNNQAGIRGGGALEDVFLWAGARYSDMLIGKATMEMRKNGAFLSRNVQGTFSIKDGILRWKDTSGQLRREFGWANGAPVDKRYSSNGTLLYEDTVSGPRIYAIGESWEENKWFATGVVAAGATEQQLHDAIIDSITKTSGQRDYGSGSVYRYAYLTLRPNYTAYYYNAGNIDPSNDQYVGYKDAEGEKLPAHNIPDGWYIRNTGKSEEQIGNTIPVVNAFYEAAFCASGVIKKTIYVEVNK